MVNILFLILNNSLRFVFKATKNSIKSPSSETKTPTPRSAVYDDFYEWQVSQPTLVPVMVGEGEWAETDSVLKQIGIWFKIILSIIIIQFSMLRVDRIWSWNYLSRHWLFFLGQFLIVATVLSACYFSQNICGVHIYVRSSQKCLLFLLRF